MPECSDCTCMLVCVFPCAFAHETAGAACTRHSLLPPSSRDKVHASLGRIAPRERRHTFICHRPRRRTIQYPRDSSDRIDRPRRTGSSAFADDDDNLVLGSAPRTTTPHQTAEPPPARASGTAANPAAARAPASSPSLFPARRYPSPPRARRVRPAPAAAAWRVVALERA